MRLLESLGHNIVSNAFDLDIHLQRGHTVSCTGHLKVHITKGVLYALDIAEDSPLAAALALTGNQAHGYTGHRCRDWHTGIHQRQRRTTDRAHGGRAVGREDVGDGANGVGEIFRWGNDGCYGTLGQRAMADLAAARATQGLAFARRKWREVIV